MREETGITLPTGEATLEGRLAPGAGPPHELWLIGHPHPSYGGDMENGVVCTARDVLQAAGRATLRWNCRGVGRSSGAPGDEQVAATDLLALLTLLEGRPEAADGLGLAGYSFGAWVVLRALARGARPRAVMLFSPPLDFMAPRGLALPDGPCLITLGDRDPYCQRATLEAWLKTAQAARPPAAPPSLTLLPGGDHFYSGQGRALAEAIADFLREIG